MNDKNQGNIADEIQLVAFKLGNEEYAVDILAVQEIIRWTHITRVPKAPPFVKGVINLRGTVIPVIDSHKRFNLPQVETTDTARIIVFRLEDVTVGLTVDLVTEVIRLSFEQIEKPQSVGGINDQFVKGIGKIADRLLIILDLDRVLDFSIEQQ
ncbi:MAG: chemotaxis protein CheW [Bacillota bacterium]|uniref:Chemotaxis protein CheW n=1 Tax=Thermanaerosceptrum fracticalcis TaxID=1712410 RepID=A0A7G6E0Z2_THEFR|nr:chemotaxis protein CheW [Thermanaerosceptrum fracticalcis]QNB45746.1 chemotaxis protein CheW [Thermanaerosceptrum fracticalcis]